MFERFTASARDVVVEAQGEARRLGDGWIGCEHLLIATAAADEGLARAALHAAGATPDALRGALNGRSRLDADALATLGIDLDEVRRRVDAAFGPGALERRRGCRDGRRGGGAGHMPFSKEAKRTLEHALRAAVARREGHIGAEHILLALLDEPEAVAVLERLGIPPARIRDRLSERSA